MCPLCYGAMSALVAMVLGPIGLIAARKDPLVVGPVVFLLPLAAIQAVGKYLGHLEIVQYLWLEKVFVPWWYYVLAGVVITIRVFRAWRIGRTAKAAKAAELAAVE
jgi:hypothetical protein